MKIFNITNYSGTDAEKIASAMEDAKAEPGSTVLIPPGKYEITSQLARQAQYNVMHGVWGTNPQRTMFNPKYEYTRGICFSGHKGTTLSARGVTLMVDGFMEPVSVRDCENVTVEGLAVDHKRKPYSKGKVTEADGGNITVEFEDDIFEGTPLELRSCLYDITKNSFRPIAAKVVKRLDARRVIFECGAECASGSVGLEFYTDHTFHSRPAVLIENAVDTVLRDVTIYSQPGMGIVGNRSENILLSSVHIIPSAGYHFSTNTDATHFTSIKGLLRFESCVFEGQGDDSSNIHGYYHTVFPTGSNSCRLREETPDGTHAQSLDYPDVGDTLELTEISNLRVADSYRVVSCLPCPEQWYCEVVLDHELPPDAHERYNFADVTRLPRVEFVNCSCRNHFARGLLLKTRGALVENNSFTDICGCGIEVAAESFWKEGVSPSDIIIRRNRIQFCGYTGLGRGAGGVCVMTDSSDPNAINISNIVIEDNIIECPEAEHGIYIRNCRGVKLARNRIICRGEKTVVSCSEDVALDRDED